MRVKKVSVFGEWLEVICRFKAVGSFIRRYGDYIEEGTELTTYVEMTLKDDERHDPMINETVLETLNIWKLSKYGEMEDQHVKISELVKDELARSDLDLYDIKLEFVRDEETGEVLLIDEISGGNMRVYKSGEYVEPLKLNSFLFNG